MHNGANNALRRKYQKRMLEHFALALNSMLVATHDKATGKPLCQRARFFLQEAYYDACRVYVFRDGLGRQTDNNI